MSLYLGHHCKRVSYSVFTEIEILQMNITMQWHGDPNVKFCKYPNIQKLHNKLAFHNIIWQLLRRLKTNIIRNNCDDPKQNLELTKVYYQVHNYAYL